MSTKASQKGTKGQTPGMTTIRERLQKAISRLVVFSIIPLVILTVILNLSSTMRTLEGDMLVVAEISADRINEELRVTTTIVSELGCSYQLSSPVFTQEQKQQYINQRMEAYGMVRGKLIGSNGICAYDGTDYSDRDYFKRSMQGEVVVSDPVIAKTDGKLSVIISAPVYADGDKNGDIVGVVFVVPDPEFLNDICAAISISEHSGCYLLGSTGTTIAHSDSAIAQEQKNNIELSQTDSSLKGIAKIEQQMLKGETGYGTYFRKGAYTLQAYAPIDGTNGWMVAVDAPVTDFLGSVVIGIIIGAAIGVIAVAYSIYKAQQIGQRIGEPVAQCTDRIQL
jgi:methyl-accepting chemotaxis protein